MSEITSLLAKAAKKQATTHSKELKQLPYDPWAFVTECVYTMDEHAFAEGVEPVKRFPNKAYLREAVYYWANNDRTRWEKSRQLMVTWLMAALHLHAVLIARGIRVAWQSKKFEDANSMLRDRLWFIYEHIPPIYRVPRARCVNGAIEVFHDKGTRVPTSQIVAAAQGEDQLRQYTFTRIVSDEFAFQEQQDLSYAAMRPTVDGGGCLTIISTSNGENFFWELGHKDLA